MTAFDTTDSQAPRDRALILVHGIGGAQQGALGQAYAERYPTSPHFSHVKELNWSDMNNRISEDGLSLVRFQQWLNVLRVAAQQFPISAGRTAHSAFNLLFSIGTVCFAGLPILSCLLLIGFIGINRFRALELNMAWTLILVMVSPLLVGITMYLMLFPFLLITATARSRARAMAAALRAVVLSLTLHTLSPIVFVFSIPKSTIIDTFPLWMGWAMAAIAAIFALSITYGPLVILCALLLAVGYWRARRLIGIPARFFFDVFRYVGDARFRARIQARLQELVHELPKECRFTLVGHSLGSVILLDSLHREGTVFGGRDVTLITMGSPIKRAFQWFLPELFFPANTFQAYVECSKHLSGFRWLNVYRPLDYVGGSICLPVTQNTFECSTGQFCKFPPLDWTDPVVIDVIERWHQTPFHRPDYEPRFQAAQSSFEQVIRLFDRFVGCAMPVLFVLSLCLIPIVELKEYVNLQTVRAEILSTGEIVTAEVGRFVYDPGSHKSPPLWGLMYIYSDSSGRSYTARRKDYEWSFLNNESQLMAEVGKSPNESVTVRLAIDANAPQQFALVEFPASYWLFIRYTIDKTWKSIVGLLFAFSFCNVVRTSWMKKVFGVSSVPKYSKWLQW